MNIRAAAAITVALSLAAPLYAGDVLLVRLDGSGDYTSLTTALAVASDGDIILLGPGPHPVFEVLRDRHLAIVGEPGPQPMVFSLDVEQSQPGRVALLSGIETRLKITDCEGAVRVDSCTLVGLDRDLCSGDPAAVVSGSSDVVFVRSTLRGGRGGEDFGDCYPYDVRGGAGLAATESRIGAWRSLFYGGDGIKGSIVPGSAGGPGATLDDTRLLAFYNLFQGGVGGDGCHPGGDGLRGSTGSKLWEQSCFFVGGEGGDLQSGDQCDPGDALSIAPGDHHQIPGWPRAVEGPRIVVTPGTVQLQVYGLPGDKAYLLVSTETRLGLDVAGRGGVFVRRRGPVASIPLGAIDGDGEIDVTIPAPRLTPGEEGEVFYLQIVGVDDAGAPWLGSGIALVAIR